MKLFDDIKAGFAALVQKFSKKEITQTDDTQPKAAKPEGEKGTVRYICQWVYKLRTVFMAIPVAFAAIIMAIYNGANLPEKIQIYFPASSESELIVKMSELSRGTAVFLPLLITAGCLLLMFCSKRTVYPWLISIFSLVLPLFFLFVGLFPV